jgi:hypothetical protein
MAPVPKQQAHVHEYGGAALLHEELPVQQREAKRCIHRRHVIADPPQDRAPSTPQFSIDHARAGVIASSSPTSI